MSSKWKPSNLERQKAILMKLWMGDLSFTELLKSLKRGKMSWSRQTLTVYLQAMIEEDRVKRVGLGKRKIYAIERDSPFVGELLGRLRVMGKVELNGLSAGEFLTQWLNSLEFAFMNMIPYYIAVGRGVEEVRSIAGGASLPMEQLLAGYLSDMNEVCQFYGEVLSERIRRGELEPERMWDARDQLLERLKKDLSWRSKKVERRRSDTPVP